MSTQTKNEKEKATAGKLGEWTESGVCTFNLQFSLQCIESKATEIETEKKKNKTKTE